MEPHDPDRRQRPPRQRAGQHEAHRDRIPTPIPACRRGRSLDCVIQRRFSREAIIEVCRDRQRLGGLGIHHVGDGIIEQDRRMA